jgi:predicted phosphodiesterase
MAILKLAVVSDIHAASSSHEHSRGSHLVVPPAIGRRNPLDDLQTLIKSGAVGSVDYLVCPGDITNQADPEAFQWMWERLRDVASSLGPAALMATCGNHDLDSRYLAAANVDDPDAKGALLSLQSPFPELAETEHNEYWAHNCVVLERGSPCAHRFALLNTCAYHGLEANETKHGRVSGRTIRRLVGRLTDRPRVGLNVLVCHHHLAPLPSWGAEPDYQYVKKGSELLRELERLNIGPWLVVHGHRHWPDCIYAQGGSTSPVLFCAGSFGKSESQVVNQFHVLSIDVDGTAARARGTIQTWFWSLSSGWQPSVPTSGQRALSYRSGFGYCGSIETLVQQVSTVVPMGGFMEWDDLATRIPELRHLLPSDFDMLRASLKPMGVRIHVEDGEPVQVGQRPAVTS